MASEKQVLGDSRPDGTCMVGEGEKASIFGGTPVAKPAALTTAETTITNAGTASDYGIQALTSSTPFGFVTQAEGETVVEVVLNNQLRINELETKLQALGIIT